MKEQAGLQQIDVNMKTNETSEPGLKWLSPMEGPFGLAGFAWLNQDGKYRRMPVSPACPLPEAVEVLANHTAGGQIRFRTDTGKLAIKVRLSGADMMDHMPATGMKGFDCYIGAPGNEKYYSTTRFDHTKQQYECILYELNVRQPRHITLNFPLYQGVEEVLIGIDPDAAVAEPVPYANDKRIIAYGTSITQGGCACRPGMAYTNIMSRRIPLEFVNLGFSGNGRGEPEVARVIAEIVDPACLIIDYEANCSTAEHIQATLPEFIRIYRGSHAQVPIIVMSQIRFGMEWSDDDSLRMRLARKQVMTDTVEQLRQQGDGHLYFVDGSELLGDDFEECTVDGIHPTDLGFYRIAEGLTPILKRILEKEAVL